MADRKAPDRRQRRNKAPSLQRDRLPAQPAPRGLLRGTRESWARFWKSEVARVVEPSDLPALVHLFCLYDERTRLWREYRRERFATGSTGQLVLHPATKMLSQLATEIRALESAFGLTPAARVRLGLTFAEATRTLRDLARVDVEEADEEDPR
jgi:P27 family predicted phage terminase small subunit